MNNSIELIHSLFNNCTGISIDTRSVTKGDLFIALKGDNFNGNLFAKQALDSGASYAIIDEPSENDERFILVDDALKCLQDLAAYHRTKIGTPIIGITGTNGKTTTKELVNCVLSTKYNVQATIGNFNNHIGVPLTLLSIRDDHDFAIVEMGANSVGEIKMLCDIAKPNYGLITNIGKAHLGGFGGLEGVIKAKSEMYNYFKENEGSIFINTDNILLTKLAEGLNLISYGENKEATYQGAPKMNADVLSVIITHEGGKYEVQSHLVGKYNFENVMCAISIGLHFGIPGENISKAINKYIPTNNRSQVIDSQSNYILLDAYNANPSSMTLSISSFIDKESNTKHLFLGDMMELGEYSKDEHQNIVDLLSANTSLHVYLIGEQFSLTDMPERFISFNKTEDIKIWLATNPISNGSILIKGSRSMRLEELVELL
ncbi:MAG: UDP-N-acetylmuramoyl-tripeptide--D-alanyl-D-alanine ligase [Flavobacteriales bacterium]|nr:UDP-N-acetylmuramoyl-tripeptide--D-alanyl-D-alanine ligase [Flavobacteriales bacterium]